MRERFVADDRTIRHGMSIIRDELFSVFGRRKDCQIGSIFVSNYRKFGSGACSLDLSRKIPSFDIRIGIGSFSLDDSLSDGDFVKLVATGVHETMHVKQYLNGFDNSFCDNSLLALLANRHNVSHCNLGAMYSADFSEIDAEAGCLSVTRKIIKPIFGSFADELLTEYVNSRVSEFRQATEELRRSADYHKERDRFYFFDKGEGFGVRQWFDFLEVLDAVPNFRAKAASTPKPYPDWMLQYCDEFLCVMRPNGWKSFLDRFQSASNGVLQAKMQASIWAWLYPKEAEHFKFAGFDSLNPEKIFGMCLPEDRESVLSRIPRYVYQKPKMSDGFAHETGHGYGRLFADGTKRCLALAEAMADKQDGSDFDFI